jgi:mRNA turnover protein 4
MPRTRRNKVISLTKTPKRNTRDSKSAHIDSVQEAASKYPTIVVFYVANLRNTHLQEVRSLWKENSKVIFGKNKVVAKALGHDVESEVKEGLSGISKKLQGPVGILFTESEPQEVLEWFADYAREDFARAGNVATRDIILEKGECLSSFSAGLKFDSSSTCFQAQ